MTTSSARIVARLALDSTLVVGGALGVVATSFAGSGAAAAPSAHSAAASDDPDAPFTLDDASSFAPQRRIAEQAELAALLSQLQDLRHQTAVSVINNIR